MMRADTSGSRLSCGLSMPNWFSTKKYGRWTLPMSWYSAATLASRLSAPTARAARSVILLTSIEWL